MTVYDRKSAAPAMGAFGSRMLGHRALVVGGVVLALIALFLLFRAIADVLLLIFAGVLLAILLRALANPLARHTFLGPRGALAVVVLLLIGLIALGGWFFAPALAEQTDQLATEIPRALQQGQEWMSQYGWGGWLLTQFQNPLNLLRPSELISDVSGLFSTTLGVLVALLVFLFLGLYLAIEPDLYCRGLLLLLPPGRRDRGRAVLEALGNTLRWWLISKFVAMVVIGLLTTIGLWLLGVPLALALGIIAALLSFIPNLGPTLATIPALLLALNDGPVRVLQVLALYLGIQALESYAITPYLERRTIALPPALTLASQVALAVLVGSIGVFLAAPLVAAVIVLVRMLYVEDVLDDHISATGE